VAAGNEALGQGRWKAARSAFERSLAAGETPAALEGLGMAAWWLDDAATVFDARERAYRLYRSQKDRRGAGRVAMTIAEDTLQFRGEVAVAKGWHRRAHRLLNGLAPIPEHGWLKLFEGDLGLTIGDDPGRVRDLAVQAAAIGRELGDVDLEMTALALEGLALVVAGELSEGMPRLDEATTAAMSGEMNDLIPIAMSCCYLVMACERIRDFARAAEWCHRVREFSTRIGLRFLLAVCRSQYAGVLTWRGSWAEAEQELQAAVRQFAATRPAMQQDALVRLAELRRHQGRFDEADALLEQVHEGNPLAILSRAALALDRSDFATAARLAQRFLRQVPALNRTDRLAALEVLLRAQLALGKRTEVRASLTELRAIAEQVATGPVKASALIAEGLAASSERDHDRARSAFEDAVDLLAKSGASLELARCRVELGRALAALKQGDAARAELDKALTAFERLGAGRDVATTTALLRDLSASHEPPLPDRTLSGLTRREVDVLKLVAQGLSNRQIAKRLIVSEFTVKRHMANLLAKLDLPSRSAAAAYAARAGMT
jgi:LuxR family transcriptional regulator, maltose regulon positive regulatory protein